jgi:hypothetical protein
MLKSIIIGAGWERYKAGVEVPAGQYYHVGFRPNDNQKKQLGLIATSSPEGRFMWLAPHEEWVKRAVLGGLPVHMPPDSSVRWDLIGVNPDLLRPWQREMIEVAWGQRGHELRLACQAGLGSGKTLVGLMLLQMSETGGVVLAPRHIHETWRSEADKWGFPHPRISTYESAHKITEVYDTVILDEMHQVKNPDANRHDHAAGLCSVATLAVGFTASLVGARGPLDFRALRVVAPGSVPAGETAWRFLFGLDTRLEEVAPGRKAYVTHTWNTEAVANFVRPYVYTVDTADITAQLPELTETVVSLPHPPDYDMVKAGGGTSRNKSKLVAQTRQCTDGFVERDDGRIVPLSTAKIDWIAEFVEHLGEPVVIYAAWRQSVIQLASRLHQYSPSVISGDTRDTENQIKRFKDGVTQVMILNSKFSAGMNLQERCRTMVFMSLSTSPVDLFQAKGRIHRPGQKRGCQVVYLQCVGTIDERAHELIVNHNDLSEDQIEKLLEAEV